MRLTLRWDCIALFAALVFLSSLSASEQPIDSFFRSGSNHTNNWAVLVGTSRFWFNYRHSSNVLGFYRTVKRLGIPDSNIILMMADDHSCAPMNPYPGEIYHTREKKINLYGDQIEIDYRGYETTAENFIRVLTDRHEAGVPRNKRLLSDEHSNVLIYMTGHGGDEFIKFQDAEEISSIEIADAIEQMHQKKRYNEILFVADTCQAFTLSKKFYSPKVIAIGSSDLNENSYSIDLANTHHSDADIGVSVVDRFSFYSLEYFERVTIDSKATLHDLFSSMTYDLLRSTALWKTSPGYPRPLSQVLLTEFFGAVSPIKVSDVAYPLPEGLTPPSPQHKAGGEPSLPLSEPTGHKMTQPPLRYPMEFLAGGAALLLIAVVGSILV